MPSTVQNWCIDFNCIMESNNLQEIIEKNGFVLIENVFNKSEIFEMQNEIFKIIDDFRPEDHPKSIFSTSNQEKHATDQYFLDSVDKISFFYEDGAVDNKNGKLLLEKCKALNKIGHALHSLNPIFQKYTFHEKIQMTKPKVVQSMYIFKQPLIGGAVMPHVDSTFLHTSYTSSSGSNNELLTNKKFGPVVGVWIAIDSADLDNGCLWFVPESHRKKNDYKFIRTDSLPENQFLNDKRLLKFVGKKPSYDSEIYVPVEVKKGSMLLIDGNVIHKSEPNTSLKSRHVFAFHVYESDNHVEWPSSNWLRETQNNKFPTLQLRNY